MKKIIFASLLICSLAQLFAQSGTIALKNGNFFNGAGFSPGVWYVVEGRLTRKAPAKIDTVIDLGGAHWVIPGMGDALSFALSNAAIAENSIKMYYDDGVQFVLAPEAPATQRQKLAQIPRKGLDVRLGSGAVTGVLGYPFVQYEGPAQGARTTQQQTEKYEKIRMERSLHGDAYWFMGPKDEIKNNWEKLLEQKPEALLVYLLRVEKEGGKEGRGLSAEAAKDVVKRAKKAGIPVVARIETAADLSFGLKIGVSGFANIPGFDWDGQGSSADYALSDADIKKLAKSKIWIAAQLSNGVQNEAATKFNREQLKRMLNAGVRVTIGSNDIQRTTRREINYWYQNGIAPPEQILRILCETTPQAIYPKRKIGKIEQGYEANLLFVRGDPMSNLLKIRDIAFRMKGGVIVE
ncbi:MAG: amidohydrolase family protein [Saprospiraceae bacterium]